MERKLTDMEIRNAMPETHEDGTQKTTYLRTSIPM